MLEDLKDKANDFLNNEKVQTTINKAKDFVNSKKGRETLKHAKDKIEDFVEDKTDSKGIFGFGKKG